MTTKKTEVNPKGGKLIQIDPGLYSQCSAMYINEIYVVFVYRGADADKMVNVAELKGKCTHISMKRKDKRPMNNWQDMQTIKNRLVGTEIDAIQIFPAESRLMNTANQYHLFCFPPEVRLPVGWDERLVFTQSFSFDDGASQTYNGEIG